MPGNQRFKPKLSKTGAHTHDSDECNGDVSTSTIRPTTYQNVTDYKKGAPRNQGTPFPPNSGKVVPVEVHHLVPRRHEVLHKRLLRVITGIDFRDRPELGV